MNYELYDALLERKKNLEKIIEEIQKSYYKEFSNLIDVNKQIKEMENDND